MKKNNLVVLASRRMPEVEEVCDADLLMDIKPLIGKIEDLEVRQALLRCWREQALKTGFNGLGLG